MEVGLKLSKARVSGEGHFKWMSFLSYWTSTRNAGVLSPRPRVGPVLLQFCASRKQHSARCYTPLCSMRRHEIVGIVRFVLLQLWFSYDSNHRQRPAWNTTPQADHRLHLRSCCNSNSRKLYLFSHQTCYLYLLSDVLPDFHCRSRPSAGRAKIDEEESEPEKSRTLCKMVLEAKHFWDLLCHAVLLEFLEWVECTLRIPKVLNLVRSTASRGLNCGQFLFDEVRVM